VRGAVPVARQALAGELLGALLGDLGAALAQRREAPQVLGGVRVVRLGHAWTS
jgi:hypothetical protein